MKSGIAILSLVASALGSAVAGAQGQSRPADHQPGARPSPNEEMQPLTAEQKRVVKSILARYRKSDLTAADAKAINDAFRSAGLRRGSGLQQAITDVGFDPQQLSRLAPPPANAREPRDASPSPERPAKRLGGAGGSAQRYSIEQAISDHAQLNTIAFDALAFLTGNLGSYTFLPPGKVSDYFGFQYMRDIDTGELGHNTSFVPRVANNVLYILNDRQRAQLIALAAEQQPLFDEFAYRRFPLLKAFRRLLDGDLPKGSPGLDEAAIRKYAGELFQIDGRLSYRRAAVLGDIIGRLDAKQKAYLSGMSFSDSRTWPERPDAINKRSLPPDQHVLVMTYASELFSWFAGSVEADVYFCPERHGTYFGSFYMKDIPAMGRPGYSIGTSITGDRGEAFLAILTEAQRKSISALVDIQREQLNGIVSTRRAISIELRRFRNGQTASERAVISLARSYGELDGSIAYEYATRFAEVGRTLTPSQPTKLAKLRALDDYPCRGAYLYSKAIEMPVIQDTDFLFRRAAAQK